MGLELERSRMEPPVIKDSIAMFSLEFRRRQDRPSIDSACEKIAAFVAENQPCSASEISDALNIPRSTVTYRLKKLVGEKVLERTSETRSKNQRYRLHRR